MNALNRGSRLNECHVLLLSETTDPAMEKTLPADQKKRRSVICCGALKNFTDRHYAQKPAFFNPSGKAGGWRATGAPP